MPDGVLVLDKPSGPTSHDVVNLVRRGTGERRAGHTGTLDPLATGVLVLCLGAATRLSEYLIGEDKRYRAVMRLGIATTTYDAQGEVTSTAPASVSRAEFEQALAGFRGEIQQRPPAFSAVKRGGRKAYQLARRGEAMPLEPRPVTVYDLQLEDWRPPEAVLTVHCSAGTYVRSLAHDLGQVLGCGAHLAALRRTASGRFDLSQAVTLEALQAGFSDGSWARHLLPASAALPHWPVIRLAAGPAARVTHGSPVASGEGPPADGDEEGACKGSARPGVLALALGPDGQLIAVVERDETARLWRPIKVLAKSSL